MGCATEGRSYPQELPRSGFVQSLFCAHQRYVAERCFGTRLARVAYNPPPHKSLKGSEPIEQGCIVPPYWPSRECRRGINGRLTSFQGRFL